MDSILVSIKKLLGIDSTSTDFDSELIVHINTVFAILNQLGVGSEAFSISGPVEKWSTFINSTELSSKLNDVKTYVYLKVKLLFDPPSSSVQMESINRLVSELEWRLNVLADKKED